MKLERFTCCQKEPHFEQIKNGYRCMDCGKVFWRRTIDYRDEVFAFDKLRCQAKFKGRKADYVKSANLFSTLQTGRVNIMRMDAAYTVLEEKSYKVKKSVLEHKLNFNNTFLTITEHGIIDIYDMETGEGISQYKSGRKYSPYKIKVFPLGKTGKWLYIDTEKIVCFSDDFQESRTILLFQDLFTEGVMSVQSADCTLEYDSFAVHVLYWKTIDGKKYLRGASLVIKFEEDGYDRKHILYGAEHDMTYDFEKDIYHGIYHDKMIMIKDDGKTNELCELPTVRSYSDGGGVFWVEEFIGFAEKLYFLTDHIIVLFYDWEMIILDIQKQEILYSVETGYNLIQSFFVMDKHTICFSAGLSTYIINV